ncbi:hypothetical protein QM012_007472 [Aureobasidium pullulans]|uniref:Phosphatidate phosphatase APP1 catalytic domain-containing protein n=1 Tax=Aureobasidium pullulans TaxID=5580 RepID=A0ABR0TPG6_AURPU
MRFPFIVACVLALVCIATASIDVCATATGDQAPEVIFPKSSRFAVLLKPLRGVIDAFYNRLPHKKKKETERQPWTITTYPSYAHKTNDGWRAHIHGNIHHRQPYDEVQLNKILNGFLIRTRLKVKNWKFWEAGYHTLTEDELARGRPLALEVASVPICHATLGAVIDACDEGSILPVASNQEGSFYGTTTISDSCALANNKSSIDIPTQRFSIVPCNLRSGIDKDVRNAADVLFVPPTGVTIIADLDDVLRVTNTWNVKRTLLNVFVRPFQEWRDMPEVLWDLKRRIEAEGQNVHFHYLTDAPEAISSSYTNHILDKYPRGSFDFRPMNFTKTGEMINARKHSVRRLMESFPKRRFISVFDTNNNMNRFPKDMNDFYPRIQCLLVRDISATERSNWVTPDTRRYLDLDDTEYLFFRIPGDLKRLSGKHLASLAPQTHGETKTFGCFDSDHKLVQAMEPSTSRWTTVKSFARAAWWNIKCAAILPMWRPNPKCPFDRIPGDKYYDGVIEPAVELEPYTDNMPWQESITSSAPDGPPEPEREGDPGHEKEDEEDPNGDDPVGDDPDDDDPDDDSNDDDSEDEDPDPEEEEDEGHKKRDHDEVEHDGQ